MNTKYKLFFLIIVMFPLLQKVQAQGAAHDSIDVLHYKLTLDMGHNTNRQLQGMAEITFVKTRDCSQVTFDLIADSIQPVWLDGSVTRGFSFDHDGRLVTVNLGGQVGDTHVVEITYYSHGYVEGYGFGGLHFDNNIYYNLGAAFMEYPHTFGRCWFPCRDNFHDKATYTLTVTAKPGWQALCSGLLESETLNADSSTTSVWQVTQPAPTYILSVSTAPWKTIHRDYTGLYGTYPAHIGYFTEDSALVMSTFDILDDVVPFYEHAFGPYRWERIGYIATPLGSMEHISNIGLVSQCIDNLSNTCQMVICHELGHAWFGNLITCEEEGDMWINEGGATFCEEVATEGALGRQAAIDYYQDMLSTVIRTAHRADGGYRSLHGMPREHTYGTTSYKKGALVWHSLRGLMGDSLFYSCMQRLFDRCAFGNLNAADLRDSLSLYSGMDLTDFFDFHVFGAGFVDYLIDDLTVDGHRATLTLRQQLIGTDQYARGNRVPVTFFSNTLQTNTQWMLFDDSIATATFTLPFTAAFAVVDYNHLISDACTDGTASLKNKGTQTLPQAYCKVGVSTTDNDPYAWVHIGHHFCHPGGDTLAGIVRMSSRFWQVTGRIPWETTAKGHFFYNMASNNSSGAAWLDPDLYTRATSLDSICLLYRADDTQPWRLVSRQRSAGSGITNGYLNARLFPGQYTLAICDTALMSIQSPDDPTAPTLRLHPNPTRGDFRLDLGSYDKKINLSIYDISGKKVLQMNDVSNGTVVRHHLPAGSYIAIIQNNFLSLQSQIIVQ